jgi:hypothetical protein
MMMLYNYWALNHYWTFYNYRTLNYHSCVVVMMVVVWR